MSETKAQLDRIRAKIQDPDFQAGKGLSNEVNIHIYAYDPAEERIIRHFVAQLEADTQLRCHLKSYHLYDIMLSIIEKKHLMKSIPKMEETKGSKYLLEKLQKVVTVKAFLAEMSYEPHELGDVILISGVGSVYPFLRMHTLLEALQPAFSDVPIVLLYPGTYDGHEMRLFGRLAPSPYYRAFNVN
ncbi:MAG: DUF1788 domain-containing protein [Selenomonadaceae bacterium]|nr:DUF1788 domain-containing protein [Selenomonadaceae bacterium]